MIYAMNSVIYWTLRGKVVTYMKLGFQMNEKYIKNTCIKLPDINSFYVSKYIHC